MKISAGSFPTVCARLALVTAALLVLAPVKALVAAEVPLAGKYSLDLPEGWKSSSQSKTELEAKGPDRARLWAGIFETDKPVEEIQAEEVTAMNSDPGYKVIERGTVKHSSGNKAQLSRFQFGGDGQTIMGAGYALRLAPKEVVILIVRAPAESFKTLKNDIQAIFNSIKPTAAGGTDDSWLTTPAEKPKGDSPRKDTTADSDVALQVLNQMKVAGTYVNQRVPTNTIVLKADGTFILNQNGASHPGPYTFKDGAISFKFSDGDVDTMKFEKDTLVDHEGGRWVKKR